MREEEAEGLAGLAHVATCSFLASRVAPSAQFWIALAGGMALARAGARYGARIAYGASLASVVQTVAMIGPLRVSGPLTQALNAPIVGAMLGRGRRFLPVLAVCLAIRLVHYAVLNVAFVVVVVGGLDTYVATYDKIAGWLRVLPQGQGWAIGLTVAFAVLWGIFFSVVQVLAYSRALERWPSAEVDAELAPPEAVHATPPREEHAPRAWAAVLVAAALCVVLLASTAWPLLGAVGAVLAVLWLAARAWDWPAVRLGLVLAALFAFGALGPAIVGAVEWSEAGARAVRAGLLVMVATWARAAAGAHGIRVVARAILQRFRMREAARLTAVLESDRRLADAGRTLVAEMKDVELSPVPMADALTGWVAAEAQRHP